MREGGKAERTRGGEQRDQGTNKRKGKKNRPRDGSREQKDKPKREPKAGEKNEKGASGEEHWDERTSEAIHGKAHRSRGNGGDEKEEGRRLGRGGKDRRRRPEEDR